ncbi:MAG TPA: HlyD family secretion protein [Candidatus Binataceae bacterium]|nr:HlyD family secretion protein [Candidatus Binataceae bacterium]
MPNEKSFEATGEEREPQTLSTTEAAPAKSEHQVPISQSRPPWLWAAGGVLLLLASIKGVPWAITASRTASTDDAYVNGHVTFVAPRVQGQVIRVLVDDNNRVHKGNLLVELDKEPYRVQVDIAKAALEVAQADLVAAQAKVRGLAALARSQRFDLNHSMEELHNQVADLHAKVEALQAANATLAKAQADYQREQQLLKNQVIAQQQYDEYLESYAVARAQAAKAQQEVYQLRAGLGLPPKPANGDLTDVPADLDQHFSAVKEAQARLMQSAAALGVVQPFRQTPDQMIAEFYKRDPSGNIDVIFEKLLKDAPDVKQAEAKLNEAQANLHQAELNLSYCDIVADIDGVVTRRNVNPGNHVVAGEDLMALRSLKEIWIDANFKETQLADLRIGQPADIYVDMYGSHRRFHGRVSGFTMGTGSTLALLPAENATGNFVKVVQRLPVRIDLTDYNPDMTPLFIGLSVTPYVFVYKKPTGPNAGRFLQASLANQLPSLPPNPQ